jgi:hypothetical protein
LKNELKNERKNEMEHIGKYKGYEVYKVPRHEMEYNSGKTLYAVAETGELVLKGEVVGKVNFNSGSVTEYDDHKCYAYKYPKKETVETPYTPKAGRGQRAKAAPVDDYKGTTIADVDLEKMIADFIHRSRTITIEEMVGTFEVAAQ